MCCICLPQHKRGIMNEAKLIKSPLRYPGGKSRALKFLAQFLPKDIDEFREPFLAVVRLDSMSRKITARQKSMQMT